jgi:putative flippase GtrA
MQSGFVQEFWRLARFSAVGALVTVIHIGVAMIAVTAAGANPTVGSMMGYVVALLVSYIGHFRFTFAVPGRYRDYLLKFAVNSLASFVLSTSVVGFATAILKIDYRPVLISLAIVVPVCNYLVNRFWVFLQPGSGAGRALGVITPE